MKNTVAFNGGAEIPMRRIMSSSSTPGSQFVKANPLKRDGRGSIMVSSSILLWSRSRWTHCAMTNHGAGVGDTNGPERAHCRQWVIRRNLFKTVHTPKIQPLTCLQICRVHVERLDRDAYRRKETFTDVERANRLRSVSTMAGLIMRRGLFSITSSTWSRV